MRWLSESVDTLVARECDTASPRIMDVVVVGSGYGGAVAALRLAREGIRVVLLERGKEYGAGEFPEGLGTAVGHVRLERDTATNINGYEAGLFDIRAGDGIGALVGNALGGTSLINAGVTLRPDARVFDKIGPTGRIWPQGLSDQELAPWYGRAGSELGAEIFSTSFMYKRDPDRGEGAYGIEVVPAKFKRLKEMAERLGEAAPANMTCKFEPAQLAVRLGQVDTDTSSAQPVMGVCMGCGNCVSGCNYNTKKTLTHTYLPQAKAAGAEIYTGVSVLRLSKEGEDWLVHFVATDSRKAQRDGLEVPAYTLRAKNVVLAAGTFGSTEILLRSRAEGAIEFSRQLGKRFSTNGDNLSFDYMLDKRVNGVGVGDGGIAEDGHAIGPTITGMIKVDHQDDVTQGVLIQDGAVPRAIAGLFHEMITTGAAVAQLDSCGYRNLSPEGACPAPFRDWASLTSRALTHTQTLLTMGHDSSAGEIGFDYASDRLRIKYCTAESQRVADAHLALLEAARQGSLLLKNPVVQLRPENLTDILSGPIPRSGTFTVHPLGGCCMGSDAARGVVDDCGRVFKPDGAGSGFHTGLYVLDGSIVPTSLGVNPLLTITALAERAIDGLLKSDFSKLARSPSAVFLTQPPVIDKTGLAAVPRSVPVHFSEAMRGPAFFWKMPTDYPEETDECDGEVACDAYLLLHLPVNSLEAFAADPLHRIDIPGPGVGTSIFEDDSLLPRLRIDKKSPEKLSPADALEMLAHLTVVGGSVCLLPAVMTTRWQRFEATMRAGLTWLKERGCEDIYQNIHRCFRGRQSRSAGSNLWKWIVSVLKLARHASEERTMEYRLSLRDTTPRGATPREYVLVGTKRVGYPATWRQLRTGIWPGRRLGRTNVWLALGQMEVTVHEDSGQLVGRGKLALDMVDMTRMHAPQIGLRANTPDALVALAGYPLWMFRLLLKTRLWDFRLPDYPERVPVELDQRRPKVPRADGEWPTPWPDFPALCIKVDDVVKDVAADTPVSLFVQRNRESQEKDVELKLVRYRNVLKHEPSRRHAGVRQFKTLLMLNGFAQSTLGFVPQEHIRNFKDPKTDEPGLAEFFYEQGFDVWLFDYRTSSILDASKKSCSMDDIAEFDIPEAVNHILSTLRRECPEAGEGDFQIYAYAHCVGAASLAMSLLGGYLHDKGKEHGKLAGVTFSQMQAFLVGSKTAQMRLQVGGILRDALGIEYLRLSAAERQPTALESVLDRLFASLPVDPGEHCPHEFDRFKRRPGICTCKRMSGTISRLLKHDRIKEETHDRLAVYFGRANTGLLVHGGRCVASERLVNADGQNVYVTDENIRRYLHLPVAILHGDENALFDVESAHRTLEQLGRVNTDLKPRAIIAKGFAHFDCTIGYGPDMHEQILDPMRHFYSVAWEWNRGADVDPSLPEPEPVLVPAPKFAAVPTTRRSHARAPLAGPVIGWTRRKSGGGPPAHIVRVWIEVDETQADRACAVATRVGASGPARLWEVWRIPLNSDWGGAPPRLDDWVNARPPSGEPYIAIGVADVEILDSQLADKRPLTITMFSVHEFDSQVVAVPPPQAHRSIAPPITPKEFPGLLRDGKIPLGGPTSGPRTGQFSRSALFGMNVAGGRRFPREGEIPEPEVHDLIEVMNLEQSLGVARALQADPRTLSRKARLEPLTAGYVAAAMVHKPAFLCGPEPFELRFVASCCRYPGLGFERARSDASLKEIARKMESGHISPQFMLMLGDQIYADATAGLMDSPSAFEKVTLATRRAFASSGFRALTSRLPTYMVIDDHEISDNWSIDELNYREGFGQARKAALRLRDTAFSTFAAYQWAHSPRNVAVPGFNYQFDGPGSSFFVLDTRSNRQRYRATPQVCSPAQLSALEAWLGQRPDEVKFIVTGSVVVPGLREHQMPEGVPARAADTWQLAPDQRRQLLALVGACKSRDVVFISGDYHCSAISTLSFTSGRTAYAVVTPPLYAPIPAANVHPREILPVEDIHLEGGAMVTARTEVHAGLGFAEMMLRQSGGEKWLCVNLHHFELDVPGVAARRFVSRHLALAGPG